MTARKWKRISSEKVETEVTPFKLLDRWGRWVGYKIVICAIHYVPSADDAAIYFTDNKPFAAFTYNTRDGRHYGASTEGIWGDSQAEVMAKARKRREDARKRQVKNWGGLEANKGGQS